MTTTNLAFVGLSAGYSWAGTAHLPGLRKLEDGHYKVAGVVNSSLEAAKASKEKNKLEDAEAYASIQDLLAEPKVDTLVVSIKVPHHFEFAKPALEAGKDVISEWPLGNGLKEAEELTKIAKEKKAKTGVVLQARKAPSIIKAKELVESGAIGTVLSTSFVGYTDSWGQLANPHIPDYLYHRENGANLLTIPLGHDLDAFAYVLGEFEFLSAIVKTQLKQVELYSTDDKQKKTRTGKTITRDSPDQVLVQGVLKSGATASVHVDGRLSSDLTRDEGLRWEIHGTRGDIVLTSASLFAELSKVSIKVSKFDDNGNSLGVEDLSTDYDPVVDNLKSFYQDYAESSNHKYNKPQLNQLDGVTTFEDALIRHRQIDAILRSSKSGQRETYDTSV